VVLTNATGAGELIFDVNQTISAEEGWPP